MNKTGLFQKMRQNAVVPILLSGIIITVCSYILFSNTMYNEAKDSMRVVSKSVILAYENAFSGDFSIVQNSDSTYDFYKGDTDITNIYSIVDDYSEASGTEISILYMDMRIHTTFVSDSGSRLAGIYANSDTARQVLFNNEEVFYKNVKITNSRYLVLYEPLTNSKGETIGMIEVARDMKDIKLRVWHSVWPILLIAVIASGFASFYSYKNTKDIIDVLKKLQLFLNKVASGNLQAEMDSSLTKRNDELGDISKSSEKMQKNIRAFVETDALTGLSNRRFMMGALQKVFSRNKASNRPFSLAICDIDFFKNINDTYGHNAGDAVLIAVANVLKEGMKGKGYVARWGGEEFLLLFDKADAKEGTLILNELLNKIREMVVEFYEYKISITMTFGITEGEFTNIESLISRADSKLYYGKTHGRNQVVYEVTEE